ncbi:hypothetical protein CANARDRAFT_26763 [[Candida] arabinofermentans NRRL YB-2248]|uniref:Uncharacterized protein n=1 Tax=[Candida] arabinofermentans NRRL YB-2248 TaxID=983967 RepID=A0A1E4T6M3_9ASCO|nr:hypothetical protein CANARDRAFT_26763 [[Candida] arabinofermentans NRRL YB-2248]
MWLKNTELKRTIERVQRRQGWVKNKIIGGIKMLLTESSVGERIQIFNPLTPWLACTAQKASEGSNSFVNSYWRLGEAEY